MPLVVHYWVDLQSVHGLRCYGNVTRILVITSLRPPREREMLASAVSRPWRPRHSNSSERGTKHVFPVNSAQIRSAVPEIFDSQIKSHRQR